MRYQGSKARIAAELYDAISADLSQHRPLDGSFGYRWVEPFVGAGGMLTEAIKRDDFTTYLALDNNYWLVDLLRFLPRCLDWLPDEVDEDMYQTAKQQAQSMHPEYSGLYHPSVVGFIGVACSWGGKWFGGYARGEGRNWAAEGKRALAKKAEYLQRATFHCDDYCTSGWDQGTNAVAYLDPPYKGTLGYGEPFDHSQFWQKAQRFAERGGQVYVSETGDAPDGWVELWRKPVTNRQKLNIDPNDQRIERLYTWRPD